MQPLAPPAAKCDTKILPSILMQTIDADDDENQCTKTRTPIYIMLTLEFWFFSSSKKDQAR